MRIIKFLLFLLSLSIFGCSNSNDPKPEDNLKMYFPPNSNSEWEAVSMSDLGWNESVAQPLKEYLREKNTKSFIILVNGRIVMEEYFNGQTPSDTWHWHSAGKTLVAITVGIAQQEGLLNIHDKISQYLGVGWTSEPIEKENLITIRHLLTMTSGLDDVAQNVGNKENLTYVADAGTRWAYSNAFQILMDIVSEASNTDFRSYFDNKVKNSIGMDGTWNYGLIYRIYHSTARSMARFGLLLLNKGEWGNEQIINENILNECLNSSQNLNPSYGYLTWLNGKAKFMIPSSQTVFPGFLVPNAPADMYAAMGAGDQRIYVIPSKKMVVVRMGDPSVPSNPSFALSGFDNELWEKINAVMN
ncbi:MAG TPA: serine hydrolase [Bacteroidales bacterium]|nr:serine hydrolase [Bacteroidales bacterium]